jgi:hypothetical protein
MRFWNALSDAATRWTKAESKDLKLTASGGLFLLVTPKRAKALAV